MKYNKLLPRHHRAGVERGGKEVDERRCSGRSTAIKLNLIASAIANPGMWFPVRDHWDEVHRHATFADEVMRTVKDLGLKHFERDFANGPRIRSNHFTASPWEIE